MKEFLEAFTSIFISWTISFITSTRAESEMFRLFEAIQRNIFFQNPF